MFDIKKLDIPFKRFVFIALFINLFTVVLVLLVLNRLPPVVPLFYGLPESEQQLVPSWALITPALASMILIGVNISISFLLEDEFLKKTLIVSALASTLFACVTIFKIAFLVGNF